MFGFAFFPCEFPEGGRFARTLGLPLPDLVGFGGIGEDEEVFGSVGRDGFLNLAAVFGDGEGTVGGWRTEEDFDPALFGDDFEIEVIRTGGNAQFSGGRGPVPSESGGRKQPGKVEGIQVPGDFFALGRSHGWEVGIPLLVRDGGGLRSLLGGRGMKGCENERSG